jgi:hypothetical protein
MRRLLPLALFAAVVIAGCGSSNASNQSGSAAASARQTELSYFPAGSPFVLSVVTDPKSSQIQSLQQLLGHFPIVSFGEQALLGKIQQLGVNYNTTIKPLLGDPVTVGFGSSSSGVNPSDVLIVWMVPSSSQLQTLLQKIPKITKSGAANGATFYNTGGAATVGVKGTTLVLAETQQNVQAAFQRAAGGSGFSAAEYHELTSGLPADPLVTAFGDLRGVISSGSAAAARAIPWVGAVKGYGVALNTTASNLTVNFRVDTTGRSLTTGQLPLAPGASAPSFAGSGAITAALSNPGQAITFILQAIKLTDPSQLTGCRRPAWPRSPRSRASCRATRSSPATCTRRCSVRRSATPRRRRRNSNRSSRRPAVPGRRPRSAAASTRTATSPSGSRAASC